MSTTAISVPVKEKPLVPRSMAVRRGIDLFVRTIASVSACVGLVALAWILFTVLTRGGRVLSVAFLTELPTPPGVPGGGVSNAIVGTALMTLLASVIGVPLGLLGGVYLAEYGKSSTFAAAVRFAANVLMGTPSILIGVFINVILVTPPLGLGHYSGYAGALALAIIVLPIVARTSEDMLRLVPDTLRESALALGCPRWRMTLDIIFRAARSGLLTGVILAIARVSGESAPLLFTALSSNYPVQSLNEPTANLTVLIVNKGQSGYPEWEQMAWGASLLITLGVLSLILVARFILRERK
ncbi:MAG TPA: phosphate ABC transporter permease PstA [Pirellulales bacterium]|jgi:phosphate transport system permease protein|nr:phosphate ABC transporter permease PstA [Pirellulales bacterium]